MWSLLRSNRDVRVLFGAQVVSFAGDWFAYVAFVGLVQDLTDNPLLVSIVYVCQALPAFLMTVITGPAADRFDRAKILRTVSLLQAFAAAGLLVVRSDTTLALGYVCLVAISVLGSFVGPASQAGLPNLVDNDDELAKAVTLFSTTWGVMLAVGAALGGVVAGVFGRDVAFAANAVSFLVAAGLISMIRRPMQAPRPAGPATETTRLRPIADMREAAAYARRDRVVLALLASKAFFAVGSGIFALLAVLVTEELGGGDTETGWLIAARGAGVATGPLIAARLVGPSLSRVLLLCGASGLVFGACYLGLSVSSSVAVAAMFVFVAHLGGGAQWTLSTYGLQRRAPDEIRGRIVAGDFGIVMLIITVSNVAAGLLAGAAGPRVAIATFAGFAVVSGSLYLLVTGGVRRSLAAEAQVERSSNFR